jgi:hypothetical protein
MNQYINKKLLSPIKHSYFFFLFTFSLLKILTRLSPRIYDMIVVLIPFHLYVRSYDKLSTSK